MALATKSSLNSNLLKCLSSRSLHNGSQAFSRTESISGINSTNTPDTFHVDPKSSSFSSNDEVEAKTERKTTMADLQMAGILQFW
ncbi:uncharacterized protein CCR75_008517 [Bremia lactucae]|uniref:Uncharacterized protein n=1 Tax=Bremia lactucae TaxID=4779 RepID=A0A976NZ95_BRELC|nr:hypothetical protein CCR75_008517 [Bremia lactucae]